MFWRISKTLKAASAAKAEVIRCLMRYEEDHMLRRMAVPGKKRRGRQKTRWKESCHRDMESVGLKVVDVTDMTKSNIEIQNHSGDPT